MKWDWLVNDPEGSAYLPSAGITNTYSNQAFFHMILEMELRSSHSHDKHFANQGISSAL